MTGSVDLRTYRVPGKSSPVGYDACIEVDASPESIWQLVSDVRRMGEWSPTCIGAKGTGSAEPIVGARFRGLNANNWRRWRTTSIFVEVSPPTEIAWCVSFLGFAVSRWGYRLEPLPGGGSKVIETWRDLRTSPIAHFPPLIWVVNGFMDVPAAIEGQLRGTLPALKAAAERSPAPSR